MNAVTAWYASRVWNEPQALELGEIAEKLTSYSWTECTAFGLKGTPYAVAYVGGPEWVVLEECGGGDYNVIESISFGWVDLVRACMLLADIHAGIYETVYGRIRSDQFRHHDTCGACR